MKKNIFPTISLVCPAFISFTIPYQHFFDDEISVDGWLILLLMISASVTHIPY